MRFAPDYRRLALPALVGAAAATVVSPPLGVVLLAVGAFVPWFSRSPERSPPDEPGVAAPADGRVSVIRVEDGRIRVDVFMNVTDVYVNRAPVFGSVRTVTHHPGAHKPTFSKGSDRNERADTELSTDAGDHGVSLVTDAFAQRIHSCIAPGDELVRGQKLGHIDFDLRADVLLPPEFDSEDVVVEKGESVRTGEIVLAWRG